MSLTRHKPKAMDILTMYGQGFKQGSARAKVYHNAFRRATVRGRLPEEAREIFLEIRAELRDYIWETELNKAIRIEKKFEHLEQGGMALAEFHALFEERLQDIEECKSLDYPTARQLHRAYLTKLNVDVRNRILGKDWKLDGENKPARTPTTYKELLRQQACTTRKEQT